MTDQSEIVQVQEQSKFLSPAATIEQAIARYDMMSQFIKQVMKKDKDFGTIPGTDKDTLLKPGAEKLCSLFGLTPTFVVVNDWQDWTGDDHGGEPFFFYHIRCRLYRGDQLIAEGDGSCNSWEKKYRYRAAERLCPSCGKPAIKRSKFPPRGLPNAEPGWYCYAKVGGCGAEYPAKDVRIIGQQLGMVKNPDVAEQVNTILKMAEKRALIAATLIATNASEYFTQDMEDFQGSVGNSEIIDAQVKEVQGEVVQKEIAKQPDAAPGEEPVYTTPVDPTVYWDFVLKTLKWDRKGGKELLDKCHGDFDLAYQEAKKQVPQ
jgi:predicted RNA-binding Zn-ribbon protein involved in translation (DUF1610 family)